MGAALAMAVAVILLAGAARAQETVVLGLQSEDGDDDIARDLSAALRERAGELTDWQLSDSSASLLQMTMAHDCDARNDACLQKIAEGLGAANLVIGTMRRTDGDAISINATLFDAELGQGSATAEARIDASDADGAALSDVAAALIRQLAGIEEPAGMGGPAAAMPVLDEPADGQPEAGSTRVEESYDEAAPPEGSSLAWLGYTLLGVSVASTGMTVFSWLQIEGATDDASFDEYRHAVGDNAPGATDVCKEADAGERYGVSESTYNAAVDQCSTGEAYELLQYVFFGTAVVTGGLGLWLVLDDASDSDAASRASRRLAITPRVGPGTAAVHASLRF